jgi:hypothetical protein
MRHIFCFIILKNIMNESYLCEMFLSYFWLSMCLCVQSILADEKMDGWKFLMRTDVGINKVVDRL